MNPAEVISLLAFKSLILGTAVLLVWGLFNLLPVRSPQLHRAVWGGVMLLGLFGAGFSVSIPVNDVVGTANADTKTAMAAPRHNTAIHRSDAEQSSAFDNALLWSTEEKPPETGVALVEKHDPANIQTAAQTDSTSTWGEWWQTVSKSQLFAAVLCVWLTGVALLFLRRFLQFGLLQKHLKSAATAQGNDAELWQRVLAERHIAPEKLSLLITQGIGPALVLMRNTRAAIAVPHDLWSEATDRVKSGILRHELTHYMQHDLVICEFVRSLAVLHWFNPLAWLAMSKFEEATEWSCDVAAFGNHPEGERHFAESILALHDVTPSITLKPYTFSGGKLTQRARLLKETINQPKESVMKKLAVLTFAALLLTAGAIRIGFVAQAEQKQTENTVSLQTSEKDAVRSETSTNTLGPAVNQQVFDDPAESRESRKFKLTANILDLEGKPIILPKEAIDPVSEVSLDIMVWKKVEKPMQNVVSFDAVEYVITDPDGTLWQRVAESRGSYWHSGSDGKGNIDKTKRKVVYNETTPFQRNVSSGTYRISVVLGENEKLGVSGITRCVAMGFSAPIVVDESKPEVNIDVSLEQGVPVSFQLIDPDTKKPLYESGERPKIRLVRPDGFRVGGDPGEDPDIGLSTDGRYHFENVVPGEYKLLVCTPIVDSRNLILEHCGDEFPITVDASGPNDFQIEPKNCLKKNWPWNITGTIRDENGEPVPDVVISARLDMKGIYIYRGAVTDIQGKYDLRMFPGFLFRSIAYLPKDPQTGHALADFPYDSWNVTVEKKGYSESKRSYQGQLVVLGRSQKDGVLNNLKHNNKEQSAELLLEKNKPAQGYDFVLRQTEPVPVIQ